MNVGPFRNSDMCSASTGSYAESRRNYKNKALSLSNYLLKDGQKEHDALCVPYAQHIKRDFQHCYSY